MCNKKIYKIINFKDLSKEKIINFTFITAVVVVVVDLCVSLLKDRKLKRKKCLSIMNTNSFKRNDLL